MDYPSFIEAIRSRLTFTELAGHQVPQRLLETADLNGFLDQVAGVYLQASEEERATIRNRFADWESHWYLHEYTLQMCDRIRQHKEQFFVRLGLAAVSIADLRPDPRDWLYTVRGVKP